MALHYRPMLLDSTVERTRLTQWYNDPATRHLHICFPDERSLNSRFTAESTRAFVGESHRPPQRFAWWVLWNEKPIGEARLNINPDKLWRRTPLTAWLALLIAEPAFRGRGLGKLVVQHLEQMAVACGSARAEVGIFEYNTPSLRLFSALGYGPCARILNRPFWHGKRWAEIRLQKRLTSPHSSRSP